MNFSLGNSIPVEDANKPAELLAFGILALVLIFTIYLEKSMHSKIKLALNPDAKVMTKIKGIDSLPGPKPFPLKLIGNILQLPGAKEMIPMCFKWCNKYGPSFKLTLFKEDFVVISSAPLAESILQSNELGHLTKTDVYHFLQGIDGLAFASGDWWRSMRKITAKAFRYQQVNKQIQVYNDHGDRIVQKLMRNVESNNYSGSSQDEFVSNELLITNCTVQIIIDTFITFHGSSTYTESLEYVKSWRRFTEITTNRILHPWLGLPFIWNLHPEKAQLEKEISKVETFANALIDRHIHQMNNHPIMESAGEDKACKTLISELIHLKYSQKEIRSEVVALLFAHETNSLALYYLLYILAAHPYHQSLCRQEVDEMFQAHEKDENNDNLSISFDDLSKLKHLERCLFESMRLLPPVFIFGRKLETELTLSNGVYLPQGTNCLILPVVMHRSPEYFDKPTDVFNPDNFLPENTSKRHAYSYIPYSAGPRICLGMKSSIANIKIVTAKLLRKFEIKSECEFEDLKFKLNLTMSTEQDLDLQFVPRKINK